MMSSSIDDKNKPANDQSLPQVAKSGDPNSIVIVDRTKSTAGIGGNSRQKPNSMILRNNSNRRLTVANIRQHLFTSASSSSLQSPTKETKDDFNVAKINVKKYTADIIQNPSNNNIVNEFNLGRKMNTNRRFSVTNFCQNIFRPGGAAGGTKLAQAPMSDKPNKKRFQHHHRQQSRPSIISEKLQHSSPGCSSTEDLLVAQATNLSLDYTKCDYSRKPTKDKTKKRDSITTGRTSRRFSAMHIRQLFSSAADRNSQSDIPDKTVINRMRKLSSRRCSALDENILLKKLKKAPVHTWQSTEDIATTADHAQSVGCLLNVENPILNLLGATVSQDNVFGSTIDNDYICDDATSDEQFSDCSTTSERRRLSTLPANHEMFTIGAKRRLFFRKFKLKATSSADVAARKRLQSENYVVTESSGGMGSPATQSLDGGAAANQSILQHKDTIESIDLGDDDDRKYYCVRTFMQNCLNLTTTTPGMASIRRRAQYPRRRLNSDGNLPAPQTPTGCSLSLLVAEAKDSIFRKRSEPIIRIEPKEEEKAIMPPRYEKAVLKKTIQSTFLQGINFLRRHSSDRIPPVGILLNKKTRHDSLALDVTDKDVESWAASLENLLNNKAGIDLFKQFLKREFSQENLEFYLLCRKYKALFDSLEQSHQNMLKQQSFVSLANQMYEQYVSEYAVKEVNLDPHTRRSIFDQLLTPDRCLFDEAQRKIYSLMDKDPYPRFLRSDLYSNVRNQVIASSSSEK